MGHEYLTAQPGHKQSARAGHTVASREEVCLMIDALALDFAEIVYTIQKPYFIILGAICEL